jgi:hypothetical protein
VNKILKVPKDLKDLKDLKNLKGGSNESEATHKGQIISKGFLMSSISSKKQTKEFDFTNMIPQVDWFSFFSEEIEDTKKPFRNHLTFNSNK